MRVRLIIKIVLAFASCLFFIGTSHSKDLKFEKSDYEKFAVNVAECLKKKSHSCLEKLSQKKMYISSPENLGCAKSEITGVEFAECVFNSNVHWNKYKKMTLREILLDCYQNPKAKIYVNYMQFKSPSGFICSVEIEEGALKIRDVVLGE